MIVSRAPLRMSFVGGGSDMPAYYRENGGAVLSTSLNKYVYLTINKKFDNDLRLSYSNTEIVSDSSQIKHPIFRNTLELLKFKGGLEITSISDIPSQGSGLGSSSSFTVALLHALSTYKGEHISKQELGRLASHIEIDLCKDTIGKQDQYAAAFGGFNFIEFNKKIPGFISNDAVIHAPESRTSSPILIPRDKEQLHHLELKNLYPCAEGAGYAGGIVSAAIDGMNCMLKLAHKEGKTN